MVDLLTPIVGVACRSCGAVRAANGQFQLKDICDSCWNKFLYHRRTSDTKGPEEEDFNRWLARKLYLDIRRMERTGVAGRCEAVSDWLYGNRGFQCAQPAIHRRDGHIVCGLHKKAIDNDYVTEAANNPYDMLKAILVELVRKDDKMRRTLEEVISACAR